MARLEIAVLCVAALTLLFGCKGEQKYPSTAAVKIEILEPEGSLPQGPIAPAIFQSHANAIKSNPVLRKAANGLIHRAQWTDTWADGQPQFTTKDLIKTRLLSLLPTESASGLRKQLVDAADGKEPLMKVLARTAGRSTYTEGETINILKLNLDVEVSEANSLIRITYYSDDAAEAKTVADTIAAAYISYVDDTNTQNIESMLRLADEYRKAQARISPSETPAALRQRLAEITAEYNLKVDPSGNLALPDEITQKERERTTLQSEMLTLRSDLNRLSRADLDNKVRFLTTRGNAEIAAQAKSITSLEIKIKDLKIDPGEEESEAEKQARMAQIREAERNLDTEQLELEQLVADATGEIEKELQNKTNERQNLRNEIRKIEERFVAGTAEYNRIAEKLKSMETAPSEVAKQSIPLGAFLEVSLDAPAEIASGTVSRPTRLNTRTLTIALVVGLVVILNAVFVIFMIKWARSKRTNYY